VVVVVVWLALARIPPLPHNPFASFEHLFPGQPWTLALEKQASCTETSYPAADVLQLCVFYPQTGPFYRLNVTVLDGKIFQVSFLPRKNALVLGDILFWWSQSEVAWVHETLLLDLPNQHLRVVTQSPYERITHFTPVRHIYFTR
jgi:hypothetical protein